MVHHAIPEAPATERSGVASDRNGGPIPATAVPVARRASQRHSIDVESLRWLRALSGTGRVREDAAERLHALLLRAARFEVARRRRRAGQTGVRVSSTISPRRRQTTRSSRSCASCTPTAATAGSRPGRTSSRCSRPPRRSADAHGTDARSRWKPMHGHGSSTIDQRLPKSRRRPPSSSTPCATRSPRC